MTRPRTRIAALAAAVALALGLAPAARAADYGVFVDVETEEDLLDLLRAQEIDDTAYETLTDLLASGVDLRTASRETLYALPNLTWADVDALLAYRAKGGRLDDPGVLAAEGVLSADKLRAIQPFLVAVEAPGKPARPVRGHLAYRTTWLAGEERVPSMWLGTEVRALQGLSAGLILALTRNQVSDVRWDPRRDALSAEGPKVQLKVPKYFVAWEDERWHAIAGTYRIGFGERLTFDDTGFAQPNGIRADDTVYYAQDLVTACRESTGELDASPCAGSQERQSPDYRWTERLRGAALGLKRLDLPRGWLQAYGFFSYQTLPVYQYGLWDRRRCADPRDDGDPACAAPAVYLRKSDLSKPASTLAYVTLPDMVNEALGGGNLTYFLDERTRIGVTGYGAGLKWLVGGADLGFQEWQRAPTHGRYGAIGVDATWGRGHLDLGAEVSRSFDQEAAGGGFAGIVRATASWAEHELEASLRWYDRRYGNPYARPIAAADEYEGLRARDEAGARLQYAGRAGPVDLHGVADVWFSPTDRTPKLLLRARADWKAVPWFTPGLWIEYQDRDLRETGRGACFENDAVVGGEPVPCTGERVVVGTQLRFQPLSRLAVVGAYQHRLVDDPAFPDRFRQEAMAWLVVMGRPINALRLRAQVRWLDEDLSTRTRGEESIWAYAEAAWTFRRFLWLKLRYEIQARIDDRASTAALDPNPAHWLRLEAEYRF